MPQQDSMVMPILLLTKAPAESDELVRVLGPKGYAFTICTNVAELCEKISQGGDLALVSKECLGTEPLAQLVSVLSRLPAWSRPDFLVLLPKGLEISSDETALSALEANANLTFLESPVKSGLLVHSIRSALADRQRQYRMRDLMNEVEASRQEALEASRAKSDFLANMSHEIRTPLGAILGFTELMMDSGISRREKKDYMLAARRNGQMLSALIDDLLDLSRVEAGRLEISKLEFSLAELLAEVVSALEPLASKKGLPLTIQRPSDAGQMIADPIRIKQILMNLVGNAIKFTSHGAVNLRISLNEPGDGTCQMNIEVEDTGIGISPLQASRLFKPFTQADTSTTRKFGGTGLGLVLSQRLARAMGGDLQLKWSIPGGGSLFEVWLPVALARKAIVPRKESGEPNERGLPLASSKILLVDDSLDNQTLISRILKLLGAEVELANDGVEGIEKAMAGDFDVVLMDLQMPRLGGVEATRLLRQKGYGRPIVALTAHALQEDRQRCLNVGCTDYLTKPVQRSHLVQVIERVAQLREAAQQTTSH